MSDGYHCINILYDFFGAEWLLDGLAGFLTDNFIKRFLGNNEARYRRFKVCCLHFLREMFN